MRIKKMKGEVFDLPLNFNLDNIEEVELVNETDSKKYYRFKKSGNYSYSYDGVSIDFEIYSRTSQVEVKFPEEVFLSQGALVSIKFPRKINNCKVKCNGEFVFLANNSLLETADFRIPGFNLSEENILKISYDGQPWETHTKKTKFKTKKTSQVLLRENEKIIINRNHMVTGDRVIVDGNEFNGSEVNKMGSIVKLEREGILMAYMVV